MTLSEKNAFVKVEYTKRGITLVVCPTDPVLAVQLSRFYLTCEDSKTGEVGVASFGPAMEEEADAPVTLMIDIDPKNDSKGWKTFQELKERALPDWIKKKAE